MFVKNSILLSIVPVLAFGCSFDFDKLDEAEVRATTLPKVPELEIEPTQVPGQMIPSIDEIDQVTPENKPKLLPELYHIGTPGHSRKSSVSSESNPVEVEEINNPIHGDEIPEEIDENSESDLESDDDNED